MHNSAIQALRAYLQGDGAVILPEMELLLFALGILLIDRWIAAREKWTEAELRERSELLFTKAKEIWTRPAE